jgi:hypothetical protein
VAGKNLLTVITILSAEYDIKKTGVEKLLSFYLCDKWPWGQDSI